MAESTPKSHPVDLKRANGIINRLRTANYESFGRDDCNLLWAAIAELATFRAAKGTPVIPTTTNWTDPQRRNHLIAAEKLLAERGAQAEPRPLAMMIAHALYKEGERGGWYTAERFVSRMEDLERLVDRVKEFAQETRDAAKNVRADHDERLSAPEKVTVPLRAGDENAEAQFFPVGTTDARTLLNAGAADEALKRAAHELRAEVVVRLKAQDALRIEQEQHAATARELVDERDAHNATAHDDLMARRDANKVTLRLQADLENARSRPCRQCVDRKYLAKLRTPINNPFKFDVKYGADRGDTITIGGMVGVLRAAAGEGLSDKELGIVLDRDFLFGSWRYELEERDPDLIRNLRGLIVALLRPADQHFLRDEIVGAPPQPTMTCPQCRAELPDFDGVGVIAHTTPEYEDGCGYCKHVTRDGGVCEICGDIEDDEAAETDCEVRGVWCTAHNRALLKERKYCRDGKA